MFNNTKKYFLIIAVSLSMHPTAVLPMSTSKLERMRTYTPAVSRTAVQLGLAYAAMAGSTIAHECGHAISASLFFKSHIRIIFGGIPSLNNITHEIVHQLPSFSIQGFNPEIACALTFCPPTGFKTAIMLGLGPLSGLAANYGIFKLLKHVEKKHALQHNTILKIAVCYSALTNFLQLVPYYYLNGSIQTDGLQILRALELPKGIIIFLLRNQVLIMGASIFSIANILVNKMGMNNELFNSHIDKKSGDVQHSTNIDYFQQHCRKIAPVLRELKSKASLIDEHNLHRLHRKDFEPLGLAQLVLHSK